LKNKAILDRGDVVAKIEIELIALKAD